MLKKVAPILLLTLSLSAAEIKLARFPSYHAGKIAFSYLGDIWVVNEDGSNPYRVTDHKARDIYPRFSPDGKWIAFSSNRYGNYDVFVVPAAGGKAKRLTYQSGADNVVGWSRDGKRVIFSATRGILFPEIPNLYEVPVDGGMEQALPTDWGFWGSYSPDGKQFAFNRHPMVWWRQHYRGTYAADVWVMDVASKKFHKVSEDGQVPNSFWPMYGNNGEIFFVSDRMANERGIKPGSPEVLKSVNNIWKMPAAGGRPTQVTKHSTGRLFFPSMSSDGKVIAYEENFGLWLLYTATGESKEVKIRIDSDDKDNNVETLTLNNEADSFDLSPSGRRATISAHGEIFTIATDRGDVARITETPWREVSPAWSPDGKWIAFISDRSGRDEVWMCDTLGANLKKLSDSDTEKGGGGGFGGGGGAAIKWSPDSKYVMFSASDHKLYRVAVGDGKTDVVTSDVVAGINGAQFSPDGKWVAYSKTDHDLRPQVFISPAGGGQERRVTADDVFSSTAPAWTRDGKYLVYTSGSLQGGSATLRSPASELYIVSLIKEEKNPADRDVDSEEEAIAADAAARTGGAGRGGAAADRVPDVKIEWDGLARRARQLTRLGGLVGGAASSPDGRTIAFTSAGGIYTISVDGQVVAELDAGDEVTIRRSRSVVRLIHLADSSFLEAMRRKLHWRGTYL